VDKTGVLLIHGLRGSPKEFHQLEKNLKQSGLVTRVVTLPGHGENPTLPLIDVNYRVLEAHCLEEYEAFAQTVDKVYIVGHSLGGICTLLVAAHQPSKLAGVITFSTPFEHSFLLSHPHLYLKMPLKDLLKGLPYISHSFTGFEKPAVNPLHIWRAFAETRRMFQHLKHRLCEIKTPVCMAHSTYDLSIPHAEMEKIARQINHELVHMVTLTQSGHQIFPESLDAAQGESIILDFIHGRKGLAEADRGEFATYEEVKGAFAKWHK